MSSGLANVNYVKLSNIVSREDRVYIKAYCEGCEYYLKVVLDHVAFVYGIAIEIHKEASDYLNRYYKLKYVVEDDCMAVVQLTSPEISE